MTKWERVKKWFEELTCKHEPVKEIVMGGYCTFGIAYWVKCKKCGKTLGTYIDRFD